MVDVTLLLLGIAVILFFGFFAEFIFKKFGIPDILFLILLGFVLGPYTLNYIHPNQLEVYAPFFTTFALLFLLYDGAFNIDLASFARGLTKSFAVTLLNFFVSAAVVTGILYLFKFPLIISIFAGVILGGICSAFVIPLINQLKVKSETYFMLTFESAFTDVLCIVFGLTVIEIISLNAFSAKIVVSKIAALFAVAGLIGVIAGIIWIVLTIKIFKEHKSYMITIAYLLLVYVITETLNGNGAIAALFFGLVLRNSKQLTAIFGDIINKSEEGEDKPNQSKNNGNYGIAVTSKDEEFFYSQISFFLKTFFFVYIGILIDLSNTSALIIGVVISLSLMLSRKLSGLITKGLLDFDRGIVKSIFGRGLAAAAIAQIAILSGIEYATQIRDITYAVILFSIILSSVSIFWIKRTYRVQATEA